VAKVLQIHHDATRQAWWSPARLQPTDPPPLGAGALRVGSPEHGRRRRQRRSRWGAGVRRSKRARPRHHRGRRSRGRSAEGEPGESRVRRRWSGGARGSERDGAAAGSAATARDTDEGGEVGAGKRQTRGGDKAGGGRRRSKVTGVHGSGGVGAEDRGDDLDGETAQSDGRSFFGRRGATRGQGMAGARTRFRV